MECVKCVFFQIESCGGMADGVQPLCIKAATEATEPATPLGQAEFALLSALVEKWDKTEDKKHEDAARLHHCCYNAEGTVYGMCAEELRILIKGI